MHLAVIMNPSPYFVRYNACQIGQAQVNHTVQFHLEQSLIDAFLTFATYCGRKAQMKVPMVTLHHPWLEREPKKIKGYTIYLERWVLLLVAFAIHYIALAVLNLQFTLLKSDFCRFQCPQGLFEVVAMDDNIICITFKLHFGMVLFNPFVKDNVQKDICQ